MYLLTMVTFQFATVKSPEKPCRMRGCFFIFLRMKTIEERQRNRYDEGSLRNQRSTAHNSDKYGYIIYHNMFSRFRMFMFIFFLPMLTHRPLRIWQFGICWSRRALNCLSSLVWSWLAIMPCWDFLIEGSLEVKLPTIWTDEKQSREEAERRERLEERRVEEKE